jgi:hypothetical protein
LNQHIQTVASAGGAAGMLAIVVTGISKAFGHPVDSDTAVAAASLLAPFLALLYAKFGMVAPVEAAEPVVAPVVAEPSLVSRLVPGAVNPS